MPATPLLVARRPQTSFIPVRTDRGTYYIDPDNPPMPDRDLSWWEDNTLGGKYVGRGFTVGGIVGLVFLCLAIIMGFVFAYLCFCYRQRTHGHRKPKGAFKAVPGGSSGTRSMGDLEDEDYMNTPMAEKNKAKKKGGPLSGFSVPKLPSFFKRGGADKSTESEKLVGSEAGGSGTGGAQEHYRKLNLPSMLGTPRQDEAMIGPSPPHTPSAAFGWNSASTVAAAREGHRLSVTDTGYRGAADSDTSDSIYVPPKYTPTASSTTSGNGNGNNNNGADSRRNSNRTSGNWDEMYQTKPAPNLFDDDDKELYSRRGY